MKSNLALELSPTPACRQALTLSAVLIAPTGAQGNPRETPAMKQAKT